MNSAFKERGRRGGAPASVCGDAEKADILLLGLLAGNLVKKSLPVCHTRLRPGLHGKPEAWPRNHDSGATPAPSDVTGCMCRNESSVFPVIRSGRTHHFPDRQPVTFDI